MSDCEMHVTKPASGTIEMRLEADSRYEHNINRTVNMRKTQQGFTLIELVVVITILGILAAFAVPRFAALDGAARVSATSGMAGSVRSASALAHALYLTAGNTPATVTMEGQSVALTFGYPSFGALGVGISAALNDTSGFTVAGTTPNVTLQLTNGGSATCGVSYTAAASAGASPVIASTTTGC
jgi:MSHA pilin protein MshA